MRGRWMVLSMGLAACQPNDGGLGSSSVGSVGQDTDATASGTGGVETGTGPSADSTGGPVGTGSADSESGEPATEGSGTPLLTISGDPEQDFGEVDLGGLVASELTVTNEGDAVATGLQGQPLDAPFTYTGGAYPGTDGDCGTSLEPGQTCTLRLSFSPTFPGRISARLQIAYDGADDAERGLVGTGLGRTGNLLVNPGGEDGGTPPVGWNNVGPGDWGAGIFFGEEWPHMGQNYIYADGGPDGMPYRLVQDIDVSPWSATVDDGAMMFTFVGFGRAFDFNEDYYRLRVLYRDDADQNIDVHTTDWQTGNAWAQWDHERRAPAGTRTVRLELGCEKPNGQTCNAYFDSLDLRAQYP